MWMYASRAFIIFVIKNEKKTWQENWIAYPIQPPRDPGLGKQNKNERKEMVRKIRITSAGISEKLLTLE